MESLIQVLKRYTMDNPYIGLVSLVLAILSISLAILFYIKGKKAKKPRYAFRSTNLVEDFVSKLDSLEMKYKGSEIRNLTVTKFVFWNNGKDSIRNSDIATTDTLRIEISNDFQILDAKIISQKKISNKFSINLNQDKTAVEITFEYIDKHDGAILQFLHTGTVSEDLEFKGTIIGAEKTKHVKVFGVNFESFFELYPASKSKLPLRTRKKVIGISMIIMPIILLIAIFSFRNKVPEGFIENAAIIVISLIYWHFGFSILKKQVPAGFEIFEEKI